ncbi:MAG: TonB-dependent receptor [Gemmatimonadota bacterium]
MSGFRRLSLLSLLVAMIWPGPMPAQQEDRLATILDVQPAQGANAGLDLPARLNVRSALLGEALDLLIESAGVTLLFSPTMVPARMVTCRCTDVTVREALRTLTAGTSLRFRESSGHILVYPEEDGMEASLLPSSLPVRNASLSRPAGAVPAMAQPRLNARVELRTGTVTGRVEDPSTLRPLPAVQVSVPELGIGTITDGAGRFVLNDVPAGDRDIEFQLIGYGTIVESVTVPSGGTVELSVQMRARAIDLDEIVVTGTGVVTERRSLGATVNSIGSQEIEDAPVQNVTDILRGRVPGLVASASGEAGAASPIRIRGTVSISQRNDPLIYVDGVRMDNSMTQVASVSTQVLDQLNPADIERVEVLSGAAAATLYGTEASSGVIQIFTRRGREGPPQFSLLMEQGLAKIPLSRIPHNVVYDAATNSIFRNAPAEDFVRAGHRQNYNLSVSGGAPSVQYFASLRFSDEQGSLPVSAQDNAALRTRLNFSLSDKLSAELGINTVRNSLQAPFPTWGIVGEFVLADPRRVSEAAPYGEMFHTIAGAMAFNHTQTSNHSTVSGQVEYRWTPSIISSATVGYNSIDIKTVGFAPYGESPRAAPFGSRDIRRTDRTLVTVDLKTSWEKEFGDFSSSFVAGGQYFLEETVSDRLAARDFAGPGLGTIRGASTVFAVDEFMEEVINAGVFAQQQFGFRNHLFLTGGLRVDGNSAFGDDFGLQSYPKVGLSYVVSDAPYWRWNAIDMFRIRAAYGTSGLQPNAFAANRMWESIAVIGNQSAVLPSNLGNADLKPEMSVERELGAEIGLLGGRLSVGLTYFNQYTQDAIVARQFPASAGVLNPQLVNLARLTSQGFEASVDWSIMERGSFIWDIAGSIATLDQKVDDLGGVTPFRVAGGNRFNTVKEGFMPGAVIGPALDTSNPYRLSVPIEEFTDLHAQLFPNLLKNAAGGDSLAFLGNPLPTVTGNLSTTIRPHPRVRLAVTAGGGAGLHIYNETGEIRVQSHIEEEVSLAEQELANPATSTQRRREIADWYATKHWAVSSNWVEKADFIRLQEVSLSYDVPEALAARLSLNSLRLTLAGSNLVLWTTYGGIIDPGTTDNPAQRQTPLAQNIDYFNTPIPRRVHFSLRAGW